MANPEFDPSGMTALVVDENAFQRGITIDQLRASGLRGVWGAANSADAWEMLLAHDPHVVLLEWMTGVHDTLDFVRRIRQSDDAPNRAVSMFMLTSRGAIGEVETARQAGVDGYLRKPVSALELGKRVRRVVERPQPFVTTSSYVGPCRRRSRLDPSFAGPWRRLSDQEQPMADQPTEEADLKAELVRASAVALLALAQEIRPGDAKGARALFGAVQALISLCDDIEDAALALGAREMGRYIEAQGATDRLDPEVVRLHAAAINQLAQLPASFARERQRVADSLKRMVEKKLRQPASAA